MTELTDRDRERFAELRDRLEGVRRAEPSGGPAPAEAGPIDPMLATTFDGELADLDESVWIAERKFDGTRIVLEKFDGAVSAYTRRHVERSETLATLTAAAEEGLPDGLILDGEYTFLTPEGTSRFVPIHTGAEKVREEGLEERFFVFDVLAVDGEWCTRSGLTERKAVLAETVREIGPIEVVDYRTADFASYYDGLVESGEEGIVLKRRESQYHVGTRSAHWRKVKAFTEADVVVVGYTPGEGRRAATFGALVATDGERYVGRVGSGFDEDELRGLLESMTAVEDRPVAESRVGKPYTPVEPFVVEVKYQEVTDAGELRAPVFLRRRPDKPREDVMPIQPPGH